MHTTRFAVFALGALLASAGSAGATGEYEVIPFSRIRFAFTRGATESKRRRRPTLIQAGWASKLGREPSTPHT